MALRADQLSFDAVARAASSTVTVRRAALWALLLSKLVGGWGVQWDIQWHVLIGRDSFWIPPHVMTYAGVALAVVVSFGVLAWETIRARKRPVEAVGPARVSVLGLSGSRGFQLAAWGILLTVVAAPVDDLWHRLFGLDVTLWSPPHLLGILGSVVNTVACLLIAREAYPAGSRLRLLALIITGAMLYGNLHLAVDPSTRIAYLYGGVRFYTLAILSALILPLALVSTARLSGHRWAPLLLVLVIIVTGMVGQQVASVGFRALKPVSIIDEEIAKDPTSPIAVAMTTARQDGRAPGRTGGLLHIFALLPALAMALADARRRPLLATVGYAVALFAMSGWLLSSRPSLAPMTPGATQTALALLLTVGAAWLGGAVARWVSDALARA